MSSIEMGNNLYTLLFVVAFIALYGLGLMAGQQR